MAVHIADAVNMALMLLSSLQVWNRHFWYVHIVWLAFQNDFEILGLRGGNGRVFVHSPAAPKTIFLKRSIIHSIKFEYDIFKQSWGFLWLIWRKVTKTILNKSLFCNKGLLYTPQSKTELWGIDTTGAHAHLWVWHLPSVQQTELRYRRPLAREQKGKLPPPEWFSWKWNSQALRKTCQNGPVMRPRNTFPEAQRMPGTKLADEMWQHGRTFWRWSWSSWVHLKAWAATWVRPGMLSPLLDSSRGAALKQEHSLEKSPNLLSIFLYIYAWEQSNETNMLY